MKKILTAIKDNISTLFSLLAIQLGMMIFGLTVLAPCIHLGNIWLILAASLAAIAFYLVLIYNKTWLMGAKDRIRIDGGRLEAMPAKGFLITLIANLLNTVLGILAMIGYGLYDINDAIGSSAGNSMYSIAKAVARLLQGMYVGILNLLQPYFEIKLAGGMTDIHPIWLLIIILPALVAGTAGYLMGSHNLRILGFFGIRQMNVNADK